MRSNPLKSLLILFFFLSSCKTYYIPVESFKTQFKNVNPKTMQVTTTRGPLGGLYVYPANQIKYIECLDKEGNSYLLQNSPSIEIRFTDTNNKKTTFYFDGLFLSDTLIIGDRSRFIGAQKAISLNNIKLIEIQDGHKNFTDAKGK
ncbi:MAG: hypothetical protein LLG13_18875 [Bacteroidales bacterium]|nr:hypothetical protein [Bacteroidales bacterium]